MTVFWSALWLPALSLLLLAAPSLCAQKIPRCQDEVWEISYEDNAEEGNAQLVITVPDITEKVESVSAILTCTDLEVNGTGKADLQINEGQNTTVFQISVPKAKSAEEFEKQGGWLTHHCVVQFTYLSLTDSTQNVEEVECEVKLLTVLGRILPRCNLMKESLSEWLRRKNHCWITHKPHQNLPHHSHRLHQWHTLTHSHQLTTHNIHTRLTKSELCKSHHH